MHPFIRRFLAFLITAFVSLQLALFCGNASAREIAPLPPSQLYGALFQRVQTERISRTARRSPMRSPNRRPKKSCAVRSGAGPRRIFPAGNLLARTSSFPLPRRANSRQRHARRSTLTSTGCGTRSLERRDIHAVRVRSFDSRTATWCLEGAFARCTTGTPTSRWWDFRRAAATISWPTWSRILPASSIVMGTFPTAAAAIT